MLGGAGAGDGEIVEANDALAIQIDVFQANGGGGLAEGLVLDMGFGDTAEQVGEPAGFEWLGDRQAFFQRGAGQEFVCEEAGCVVCDGLIDRADQRVFDGGLGPDVGEEGFALVRLIGAEFIHQHLAGNRDLFGQPGAGECIFGNKFLEAVFTEEAVFGCGIHGYWKNSNGVTHRSGWGAVEAWDQSRAAESLGSREGTNLPELLPGNFESGRPDPAGPLSHPAPRPCKAG